MGDLSRRSDAHFDVHIGDAIRAQRLARGWTIDQAAGLAGLSRNTVANAERSALPNPTLSTLLALMEIFELRSVDQLFGPSASEQVLSDWIRQGRPGTQERV